MLFPSSMPWESSFKSIQYESGIMHRGYTCLWRKIWSNAVLAEPGRRFSRLEAWLYIVNVLAAGKDDEAAGLKRGEFVGSVRRLAECFHWSIGAVHRFLEILIQNSMIMRVEQDAGHFIICNYENYNAPWNAGRNTSKQVLKENKNKIKGTCAPAGAGACASPNILLEIYQQHNQALPGVKAVTAERLRKCRSRINQAVYDGCLEQYLADFVAAVKKAQSTPFLRGEGARGWRASFDWLVANHLNVYAVLEGKYDGPAAGPDNKYGGGNDNGSFDGCRCGPPGVERQGPGGRTSRGDPIYVPRQ
jgi:hypothetical protein